MIAYVEHPITKEEKRAYNQKGFTVVDARFKPNKIGEDDKVFMKPKPKAEASK